MKIPILILSLIILLMVTVSATPQKMAWEYKTEDKCFGDDRLNALGAEGWEMAGFAETNVGGRHCIFKRPKP